MNLSWLLLLGRSGSVGARNGICKIGTGKAGELGTVAGIVQISRTTNQTTDVMHLTCSQSTSPFFDLHGLLAGFADT